MSGQGGGRDPEEKFGSLVDLKNNQQTNNGRPDQDLGQWSPTYFYVI